jgi:hypothetical protein
MVLINILTIFFLMLGGAFIILLYDAYKNTKQRFLLILSTGFFFLIIGGALTSLLYISGKIYGLGMEYVLMGSIIMQIVGIFLIYYSVVK